MFLAPYKLATNPFDATQARPLFESESVLALVDSLGRLAKAQAQCLLVSGKPGVGKTRVVRRWLQQRDADFSVSWVRVGPEHTREQFFNSLLADLGLQAIEGSVTELRNILEVFLKHQAGQGRRSIIVADDLDRMPAAHLGEFEWLADLRWRGRPVVNLVLIARDDELVRSLVPHGGKGNHIHQPLRAFHLEETWNYIVWCLQNAGCDDVNELMSEDLIPQIHGFSGGIAGQINALCGEVLNQVAAQINTEGVKPVVTVPVVRAAAKKLGMAFDAKALNKVEEPLSAESVRQSDPGAFDSAKAKVLVASGGSIVAEIELERPRMVLGRDRTCDISLESRYVSRFQNLFMETENGWWLLDLNSTNGSYINGRRVKEHRLQDGDVIAVGRHQLRFIGPGSEHSADTEAATLIQPVSPARDTVPIEKSAADKAS